MQMKKVKRCECKDYLVSYCGDCNAKTYSFEDQEIEDILSALSAFKFSLTPQKDFPKTIKDLKKLNLKIWKMKRLK